MSYSTPRKRLPVNPSLEHLQKQAKRFVRQNPALKLAAAQLTLARDYGCKNWGELAHMVETMSRGADQTFSVSRESESLPKASRAVDIDLIRNTLSAGRFTRHDLDAGLAHALWYGDAATWPKRKAIADLLLEHGADPDGQYGSAYGPIVFGTGECISVEGLETLIEAGADITSAPLQTKYGLHCPMSHILGTYIRGRNDAKHRYIDLLLQHGAYVPPEVTDPILAIHRGQATELGQLIENKPELVNQHFRDMPYGNMILRGATLLHCAVEFGEPECIVELLKRGADINARAEIIDGIGGQTPLFHAIATNQGDSFSTLEFLVRNVSKDIDPSVRATWHRPGEVQSKPMTPLEYAEYASREEEPKWKRATKDEVALLRELV